MGNNWFVTLDLKFSKKEKNRKSDPYLRIDFVGVLGCYLAYYYEFRIGNISYFVISNNEKIPNS